MIQRIQSLYLLVVVVALVLSLLLPYGSFVGADMTVYVFSALGVSGIGSGLSMWGLFSLLTLSAVIALCAIFLYKNRILQMRVCMFNIILLIGYYIAFWVFMFTLKSRLEAAFQPGWALSLPLVAVILLYLAWRAIGKDEVMVKAADRLR